MAHKTNTGASSLTMAEKQAKAHSAKETLKTIVIVTLISGLICFVAGVHYQQHIDQGRQAAVNSAVKAANLKN